jgi:hypothetical protein
MLYDIRWLIGFLVCLFGKAINIIVVHHRTGQSKFLESLLVSVHLIRSLSSAPPSNVFPQDISALLSFPLPPQCWSRLQKHGLQSRCISKSYERELPIKA